MLNKGKKRQPDNPRSRVRVLHRNHILACEQFIKEKGHRKQLQQQQQHQKQHQHFNKETSTDTWDSSNESDADLTEFIPAINIYHEKVSQTVIEKQQQKERCLEQLLRSRKYITRRPQILNIIKVQGDLPTGRKVEGRPHIHQVISVQVLDNLIQLHQTDEMIGGKWRSRGKHLTVVIWTLEMVWLELTNVRIIENWMIVIKVNRKNIIWDRGKLKTYLVIANQMMPILNILRQMNRTQMMYKKMKIMQKWFKVM